MGTTEPENIDHRLAQLEKSVEELIRTVGHLQSKLDDLESAASRTPAVKAPEQPPPQQQQTGEIPTEQAPAALKVRPSAKQPRILIPERMRSGEYWLGRVGIGLLLFGVVFLFKYSVDRGWITPWFRAGSGLVVGAVLLYLGLRIYTKRRAFATLLLGGGIAAWYITGFASFQLLELITHKTAMGFMLVVTLITFILSLRQNDALLSLIGALGGFGTPFMLYSSSGDLPGLVMYTCLIIAGTLGIFFFKGWRSLLWLSSISSWLIFFIGWLTTPVDVAYNFFDERWSLQAGLIFTWLCFGGVPVWRELFWIRNPNRWPHSRLGFGDKSLSQRLQDVLDRHLHVLTVSSALMGLGLTRLTWPDVSSDSWGGLCIGLSVVYFAVAFGLRNFKTLRSLVYTQILVALFLLTLALTIMLEGNTLLFTLATEAVVLHLIARRISDRVVSFAAHLLHGITLIWMAYRVLEIVNIPFQPGALIDSQTLTDLWVVATYALVMTAYKSLDTRRIYGIIAASLLAAILIRQLESGWELAMLALEAGAIMFVARAARDRTVRIFGHIFFAVLVQILCYRMIAAYIGSAAAPVFNWEALANLVAIGTIAGASGLLTDHRERTIYRLAVHLSVLGWLGAELSRLPDGQGWVSVSWGVYAAILLFLGLRLNIAQLRLAALGTLMLIAAKLFLVDLAELETLWRVLLFIGFGGVFLLLSYYFRALWKTGATEDTDNNRPA